MLPFSNALKTLAPLAACAMLVVACASTPKHSYPADADPRAESAALSEQIQSLKADQLDVAAPVQFARAEKELQKAEKQISKDGDRTRILNHLQLSKDAVAQARSEGEAWKKELTEAVAAREKAISAGADSAFERDFRRIDDRMTGLTDGRIKNPGSYKEASLDLQKRYMDIELRAIQHNELGQARELVKAARDAGARRYAPQSLVKTDTEIASAERLIEANRNEASLYRESVDQATRSARSLLNVTMTAKDARNKTPEEIALAIQAKEREIAQAHRQARVVQSEAQATSDEMRTQNEQLGAKLAASQAAQGALEKEHSFNQKLKEVESRFNRNEADVYRQGDNIVVRLKSMQFASSRSDLPASSLATLAKVNEAIQELGAERVVVEGHTDSTGSKDINQKISEDRAQSVSEFILSQSALGANSVEAVGYGFDKPLSSNRTAEGRAQNRRVDIVITPSTVE